MAAGLKEHQDVVSVPESEKGIVHERLSTDEIGRHHVQAVVTSIDTGAPLVEFYCCRCLTIKSNTEWFRDYDCTGPR